jgi:uncharacterized protein (TIGR02186 family)
MHAPFYVLCASVPLWFSFLSPAFGEDLVAGLSQDQIRITSNYTGTSITAFGAIESIDPTSANTARDVVVVVRGPVADMTVRRKVRIAGVWVNRDSMLLRGMPSYYAVLSSRPLDKIASADTLRRYQIGTANVEPQGTDARFPAEAEPFRKAAIADRGQASLYVERADVEFLGNSLFRARVPIPATVPRGEYLTEMFLFRDGNVISAQTTPLFIDQFGFERRLFRFAQRSPLAYGLSSVFLAGFFGWLSSLMFRERR